MSLAKKLLKVMTVCRTLTYDSNNEEVGYKFVSAAKVNAAVNAALAENGIVSLAVTKIVDVKEVKNEILATVEVEITLKDTDGDESFVIRGAGSGIDAGDKAVAKAQTMAVKYAWKNTLLIADSSDEPDNNADTRAYERVKKRYEEQGMQKHPSFIAKVASEELKNKKVPF